MGHVATHGRPRSRLIGYGVRPFLFLLLLLGVVACGDAIPATPQAQQQARQPTNRPASQPTVQSIAQPTPEATITASATPAREPSSTTTVPPTPTATASLTPTPDPYAGLTIADLAARSYGGGELEVVQTLAVTGAFTRTLITYPSDGLTIYGFMNVPAGPGPFPVALVLHGYIPPEQYGTIAYTTRYADALARAGYLVIHPNYRNYPPSDEAEAFAGGRETSDFRVGYAVDVLNLIAVVEAQGGRPGPLQKADPEQMHLLGHSMGGGIALRVVTVNPEVDAAVLYGSMSGDEYKNYERILLWSNGEVGEGELATPAEDMARIAPIYHLARIEAAVSIHHGEADDVVPPAWSEELCQRLRELEKTVECFSYAGAPHTFRDEADRLFQQRVVDFFNRY